MPSPPKRIVRGSLQLVTGSLQFGTTAIGVADTILSRAAAGVLHTDGVLRANQLISTVAGPTPPLVVGSTALVTNLNAEFVGGLRASDLSAATHKAHRWLPNEYGFGSFMGESSMHLYLETAAADGLRWAAPTAVEYHNGSAWVAWSGWEPVLQPMLDGSLKTQGQVAHDRRRFRITWNRNPWPGQVLLALETNWTGITWPGVVVVTLETFNGTAWVARGTANFGVGTTAANWGVHLRAFDGLHNGEVPARITVEIPDWVDAPGYTTFPIRRLMILHQFSSWVRPATPFSWDYAQKVTFDGAVETPSLLATAATVAGALTVNGTLSAGSMAARAWTTGDADIAAMMPGSKFGGILEGGANGHLVIGIRSNDIDDSFAVVTKETGNANYTRLAFRVTADGRVLVGGNAVWHAGNFTPASKADAGHTHDDRYLRLSGGTITGSLVVQNADPRIVLYESDAPDNGRRADWIHQSGTLVGRLYNDAGSSSADWLTVTRSGTTPWTIQLASLRTSILSDAPTLLLTETGQAGDLWGVIANGQNFAVSRFDRATLAWKSNSLFIGDAGSASFVADLTATRFTSTVATGTAPFQVASSTMVAGLNAQYLGGLDASAFASVGHLHSGVYEPVFAKGNLIAGSGVSFVGSGSGRLYGPGDITINAAGGGGSSTLAGLSDVSISSPANGQFLKFNGTAWVNAAHGITPVSIGAVALSGGEQTIASALKFTGLGADISGSGDYRLVARDSTGLLRPMSALFARGWMDAAAFIHGHSIGDVAGLQSALDAKVPTSRIVTAGSGLSGGGSLSGDITLAIADTGVTANTYGTTGAQIPVIQVNSRGQITSASNRTMTAADLGSGASLVFATISEVNFVGGNLTDGVYRSALGTLRSGTSTTIAANALQTGAILRIEAWGMFAANDGWTPRFRIKIGSSLTVLFEIDEPDSGFSGTSVPGEWNAVAHVIVTSAGSSASTVVRGHFDTGAPVDGASDYLIRTRRTLSGTLNTTVANSIAVEYAGSASMLEFRCSTVLAQIL